MPLPRRPDKDPSRCLDGAVRFGRRDESSRTRAPTSLSVSVGMPPCRRIWRQHGRVPIVVHEANAKAGWRIESAPATPMLPRRPQGSTKGATLTGLPLRPAIVNLDRMPSGRPPGSTSPDPVRPCLFVFGGSQGARCANDAVAAAGLWVWREWSHAVGGKNADQRPAESPTTSSRWTTSTDGPAMRRRTFALCRSGAMTVAELRRRRPACDLCAAAHRKRRAEPQCGRRDRCGRWCAGAGCGAGRGPGDRVGRRIARRSFEVDDWGRAATQGSRDAADKLATMVLQAAGGPR